MSLRGHNETWGSPRNGNFMGLIELISEFDPFLREHLTKCQSEKRNISYLSKTVYEELIEIVQKEIVAQINNSDTKCFSIIIDSTPDLSHVDQLAVIARYVYNGQPYERFLTFIPITNHTAQTLFNTIKNFFLQILVLENIRGQSYDNAASMSGKYSELQARLKEINKYADFVPCAAHSLNLVGVEQLV
ncbi:zinc finger MYM-type protein 1-like [Hydra vulgaris]|uniref:Zinc finger MYM-type protein 1-like n=1 Tax=Hydra vulgaris TaxID=6087 RepID=A0ABM4CSE7_HYDVU